MIRNTLRHLYHAGVGDLKDKKQGYDGSVLPSSRKKDADRDKSLTKASQGSKISMLQNMGDHKRRLLAEKYELRRKLYKAFCRDPDLPSDMREKHRYKLSKLPRNSSFARVRNRCIFTGRPRSVYEFFRVSRIVFRELASRGQLMGVKKASW